MRGLQGFAAQATAAYGKLNQQLSRLIPTVGSLTKAWSKMRDSVKESVPHIESAANSIGRARVAIATTIPLVSAMATQFAALGATMRAAGTIGQSSMVGLAASTLKASAATTGLGAGMAAALAPIAAIAAAAGVAYVAVAKWEELPLVLKAFLLAASPLVVAIRSIAAAWNVATLPIRTFRAGLDGLKSLVTSLPRALGSLTIGLGRLATATARAGMAIGRGLLSGLTSAGRLVGRTVAMIAGSVSALGGALGRAGAGLGGLAGRVVDPLNDAAKQFAVAGSAALALAASSGLAVDQMTALGYAAEQVGGDAESVALAVQSMNGAIAESNPMIRRLGLDVGKLSAMNAADRFTELGVAVASLADPFERSAAAQALFGANGDKLVGMFAKGKGGLADMRREAERLGLVMSGDAAESAKRLGDATRGVQSAMAGLWRTLGAAVAPQLTETARNVVKLVASVTTWAAKNQSLVATVFKVASGVAFAGAALSALGSALAVATPGIVALTGALAAGWIAWGKYGDSAGKALSRVFPMLRAIQAETTRVLGGVWDAIQGGNLELAVQVAWLGAQKAWIEGLHALATITNSTLGGIFEALAAGDWRSALGQAWNAVQSLAVAGLDTLDRVFTGLTNTIDQAIASVRQGVNTALHELARLAMNAVQTVVDASKALESHDPTGLLKAGRLDMQRALLPLQHAAAGDPTEANRALQAASDARGFERIGDLAARGAGRDARLAELSTASAAQDAAQAADARGADVANRLADALNAARRAREDARQMQGFDVEQRNRLAGAAGAMGRTSTTPAGATFSAAALMASGGAGGGVQKEIAANTRAAARALTLLVESDKKRAKEARAFALIPVA